MVAGEGEGILLQADPSALTILHLHPENHVVVCSTDLALVQLLEPNWVSLQGLQSVLVGMEVRRY